MVVTVDLSAGQAAESVTDTGPDVAERASDTLTGSVDHTAQPLAEALTDVADAWSLVGGKLTARKLRGLYNR